MTSAICRRLLGRNSGGDFYGSDEAPRQGRDSMYDLGYRALSRALIERLKRWTRLLMGGTNSNERDRRFIHGPRPHSEA